jgi:acetyl esterase/lipase
MTSIRANLTMLFFLAQKHFLLRRRDNTRLMRRVTEFAGRRIRLPANIRIERSDLHGIGAERLINAHATAHRQRTLIYIHGGGYVIGSPATHRAFAARLGQRAGAGEIWLPDYRLAPEHPFPAALDDVLKFWHSITVQHPQREFILAGESAGAGLCVSLCVAMRERQQRLPARMYLLSPWLDLSLKSRTHFSQDRRDPFLGREFLEQNFARFYAADTPRDHPLLSPLFSDLQGLPPTLVHVGSREVLLDDSRAFATKAQQQGAAVTLEVHTGLWHAWPVFQTAPECIAAIRRAGEWLAGARS